MLIWMEIGVIARVIGIVDKVRSLSTKIILEFTSGTLFAPLPPTLEGT